MKNLTKEDWKKLINETENAVVIDVRTPEECAEGTQPIALQINFSSLKTFVDPSVSFTLNLNIEDKTISKKSEDKAKTSKRKQLENKSNIIFLKPKSS